jgi:hypothetical protein
MRAVRRAGSPRTVIAELLCPDDAVHVGLHEFLDEVDLGEALVRCGLDNVENGDNVLVVEPSQELDLSESAQALRKPRCES